jgi:hypothetical protein
LTLLKALLYPEMRLASNWVFEEEDDRLCLIRLLPLRLLFGEKGGFATTLGLCSLV